MYKTTKSRKEKECTHYIYLYQTTYGEFSFVWLSAIVGFILSFKKLKEHSNLETACYIAMGACILVAMKPLMDHLAQMGAGPAFGG